MRASSAAVSPPAVTVRLSRKDFLYYTWALALERPVLLFLLYSFVLLFLLAVTGVWPAARVFSLAVLLPLSGHLLWVRVAAQLLWARHPALQEPRHYTFKAQSYLVSSSPGSEVPVPYCEVAQLLSSRRALYLLRRDGSADILPRSELPEGIETFLAEKIMVKRSRFL